MSRNKKTGRKTMLTGPVVTKIKYCILEGKNLKETANYIGIKENTFNEWYYSNTQDLREKVKSWRIEKMITDAEKVSRDILNIIVQKGDGKLDLRLLKLKQKESIFLRKKLLIVKENYV